MSDNSESGTDQKTGNELPTAWAHSSIILTPPVLRAIVADALCLETRQIDDCWMVGNGLKVAFVGGIGDPDPYGDYRSEGTDGDCDD